MRKRIVLAIAFSAASTFAFAQTSTGEDRQTEGSSATNSFTETDRDHNGYLDQREGSGIGGLGFQSVDMNSDGRISRGEFEIALRGSPGTGG
ncbi:MAG TPA: EF-hand domain-containing protein [Burkholderiales bacterium]